MKSYHILGIMSGTSLDGIDIAEIFFQFDQKWTFQLGKCETIAYSNEWVKKLKTAFKKNREELIVLNKDYTNYLAGVISNFISNNNLSDLDAICSHGHTILHEPQNGFTLQIGNLPEIAKLTKHTVVCDFRVQDVQFGGQGAPLVPIGDQVLFSDYEFCLNLGGFANISFQQNHKRIAFDNCPVNTVLNVYAQKLGKSYDENGNFARKGKLNLKLLEELNSIEFYKKAPPKSLGIEWVESTIFPIIETYTISNEDILHTFTTHIAQIIAKDINGYTEKEHSKILITGGGAYNSFLIERLQTLTKVEITIPEPKILEFKEALIFGLLGVLKLNNEINTLASVTGASKDHSAGKVFRY